MKFKAIHLLFLILLVLTLARGVHSAGRVAVEYFYIDPQWFGDCPECYDSEMREITRMVVNVTSQYGSQITVEWLDILSPSGQNRFAQYNLTIPPALVINEEYFLVGKASITESKLREVIEAYLGGSNVDVPDITFPTLTLPLILTSGLIDGINPCAFALIVFFLGYLYSINRAKSNILFMGLIYILGLFITYLLVGLVLRQSVAYFGIGHIFQRVGVVLVIILGLFTIKDALWPGKLTLKFPSRVVPTYKEIVQKATMPAAFSLGILVGLCEFPCTGAIYFGVLSLLIGTTFTEGLLYLILYNIVFILPLIVLLLFASNLKTLSGIDKWRLEKRRKIKLITGVFMIALGLFVLYWVIL